MSRLLAALVITLVTGTLLGAAAAMYFGSHEAERARDRAAHHCRLMQIAPEESPQRRWLCDGGEMRAE